MTTGTRIDLSLADLEANDPRGQSRGNTRRFRCPLDVCDGATYRGPAQPLAVDMTTGAWMCHRCGSSGLLTDYRTHRPADHRARMSRALARATRPRPVVQEPEPKSGTWPWAAQWDDSVPLTAREAMPAAEYVMGRGIRWGPAHDAGVRFHPRYGTAQRLEDPDGTVRWRAPGPAVVFPLTTLQPDGTWAVTGVQGRYIDGREADGWRKVQTGGTGVFLTPGAVSGNWPIVICEGPFDALALAQWPHQPRPAMAVQGTTLPKWLATHVLGRTVILAQDADTAGDAAADRHAPVLTGWGARVSRKRPRPPFKDWAEEAQWRFRADQAYMKKVASGRLQGDAPGPKIEPCETGTCENNAIMFHADWGHLCERCLTSLTAPRRRSALDGDDAPAT
jgi:Toprim-like